MTCCKECGAEITKKPKRGPRAEFCSKECRQGWKNRRLLRGAMMYDVVMNWRFERKGGGDKEAWQALTRLAATFKHEDKMDRDNRPSYRRLRDVLEENPWINSIDMI